jgi:hypothetical protein
VIDNICAPVTAMARDDDAYIHNRDEWLGCKGCTNDVIMSLVQVLAGQISEHPGWQTRLDNHIAKLLDALEDQAHEH